MNYELPIHIISGKTWQHYFTVRPCLDGWSEFSQKTPLEFWNTTKRGDWLWWWMRNNTGYVPTKTVSVEFARSCAERAHEYYAYADAAADAADAADDAADAADAAEDFASLDSKDAKYNELGIQADWIRAHVAYPFGD